MTSVTILLVDDHTVVRDGLRALLESQGDFQVVGVADSGRLAVQLARDLSPSIVLMDIAMPDLNGIEATRQIIECCSGSRVVILSMYATSEYVYRAFQAGALGYVLKESAGSEVINAIQVVNTGKMYISQKIKDTLGERFPHQKNSPLESLSAREREVLQLMVEGKTSVQIAEILSLSPKTVDTYRSRIMTKLELKDIPALVKFAIQHGLTTLES